MTTLLFPGIILFVIILLAVVSIPAYRIKQEQFKKTGKYPKGHYMGMGIAIGMALGLAGGVALDNISLGPAVGMAIGVAIGAGLEQKYKDKLRPLTEEELGYQRILMYILLGLVILGFAAFYLFAKGMV